MNCAEWTYLVFSLLLLTFSTIGFAMFAAFFPPAMQTLGLRQAFISPIFSSFTIGNVAFSILSAPLATRFGRRPVLLVGVTMVSLGALLFAFVPDLVSDEVPMVTWFMVARVTQGSGGGIVSTVSMSMLSDQFPRDRGKVLGLASSSGAMAFFVGPPIGGLLFEAGGFRLPFLFAAALPTIAYVGSSCFAPNSSRTSKRNASGEIEKPPSTKVQCQRLWSILTVPLVMPAFASFLITCKWTTFDIGVTLWMQDEFGYSIGQASLAFSCASIAYAIFSPVAGSVTDCIQVHKRKFFICAFLYICGISSSSILPYQLTWSLEARRIYAYVFCFQEGTLATFLSAPCLPTMHEQAKLTLLSKAKEAHQAPQGLALRALRGGNSRKESGASHGTETTESDSSSSSSKKKRCGMTHKFHLLTSGVC